MKRFLRSDSLRAAFGFTAGGFGFAAGNIILAKVLSPAAFGVVSLTLALNQFGLTFGPFGMEVVVNRHRPKVDRKLISTSLASSTITAIAIAAMGAIYYGLSWPIVTLMFVMVIGSSTNRICVSVFQGEHALRGAMLLSQVHNYVLLLAAFFAVLFSLRDDVFVVGIATAGYVTTAAIGWWVASQAGDDGRKPIDLLVFLKEGIAALGFGAGMQVLAQFERLAIPKVASIEMLGTYAALAAVAGAPFRMIQAGTNFTLMPRLRGAPTAAAAKNVLVREGVTVLAMTFIASALIVLLSQFLFRTFLNGKYAVNASLIGATVIVGVAKIWAGLVTTVVSSCGSSRALGTVSILTVACLGIAAVGVLIGSRYGLLGILYGVGAAWCVLCLGGSYLAAVSLRTRFAADKRGNAFI